MFKIFGKRPTTKFDVAMALVGAAMGVWKAYDTVTDFKTEQAEKEIEK